MSLALPTFRSPLAASPVQRNAGAAAQDAAYHEIQGAVAAVHNKRQKLDSLMENLQTLISAGAHELAMMKFFEEQNARAASREQLLFRAESAREERTAAIYGALTQALAVIAPSVARPSQ